MLFSLPNPFITNKQTFLLAKQRCRDGVMNDFLSWCMHLLVPFLFQDLTSLHPHSFHRNDFFHLYTYQDLGFSAFRFGLERSSYSVVESDAVVSVCVTAGRGDGSEVYTATLSSVNISTQGIAVTLSKASLLLYMLLLKV